jgi:small neutral amino acid transporter SnatA (MarC family)
MLTDLYAAVLLFIFSTILLFIAEAPLGFLVYLISLIVNYRSPSRQRISLAYGFFLAVSASVANSAQFVGSMVTGQISDPPIFTPIVWFLWYNIYFIITSVINLIPTEIIIKKKYPQGHRHYFAITIMVVVFLNLISWSIQFHLADFDIFDSVLFYLIWAPGFGAGLAVFNYIMQKVPPRNMM